MSRYTAGDDALDTDARRLGADQPGTADSKRPVGKTRMWRALFLALGIYLCILGGECLVVDRFILATEEPPPPAAGPATLFGSPPAAPVAVRRELVPAEWAPWSLLSAGTVVILYAITINRQG
jgi:hypothetical protein